MQFQRGKNGPSLDQISTGINRIKQDTDRPRIEESVNENGIRTTLEYSLNSKYAHLSYQDNSSYKVDVTEIYLGPRSFGKAKSQVWGGEKQTSKP